MIEHTPGPWKECGGQVMQAYAPYNTVATTYDYNDRKPTEDSPNAKLIAAAPDMAEALRTIMDSTDNNGVRGLCRRALAKAGL
jgi:hypothetical protein